MKKVLFTVMFAVIGFTVTAQEISFGANAGLANLSPQIDGVSGSEMGFFLGVFADIELTDELDGRPSLNYLSAKGESFIALPLMLKYNFGDSGFFAQAGPQINFLVGSDIRDSIEDAIGGEIEGFSGLGIGLGFGVGYDINENIFADARYTFEFTNHVDEGDWKYNMLTFGVGYKF